MKQYILKRLLSTVITIFIVVIVTFVLMHLIPGGPFDEITQGISQESLDAINARYHLDEPVLKQFVRYLSGLLQGDMGPSYRLPGVTVNDLIAQGFPVSARVGVVAIVVILVLGLLLGIVSALCYGRFAEHLITVFTTLGTSIPAFVVATSILYFFCELLNVLPSNGLTSWKHYIGPVIALSLFSLSFVIRLTSSNLREVLSQDYIRTARANGLPERRIILKYAMRNAIIPVITYMGPTAASVLTGSFVVESVFTIPGLGKYFVSSINSRDYLVLMGVTLFYAVLVIFILFLIDIVYAFVDPRIKLGGEKE